jgi:hypothetical protein
MLLLFIFFAAFGLVLLAIYPSWILLAAYLGFLVFLGAVLSVFDGRPLAGPEPGGDQ